MDELTTPESGGEEVDKVELSGIFTLKLPVGSTKVLNFKYSTEQRLRYLLTVC